MTFRASKHEVLSDDSDDDDDDDANICKKNSVQYFTQRQSNVNVVI